MSNKLPQEVIQTGADATRALGAMLLLGLVVIGLCMFLFLPFNKSLMAKVEAPNTVPDGDVKSGTAIFYLVFLVCGSIVLILPRLLKSGHDEVVAGWNDATHQRQTMETRQRQRMNASINEMRARQGGPPVDLNTGQLEEDIHYN